MLESASEEFKVIFLLEFTKRLIKNSSPMDFINLQEISEKENLIEAVKSRMPKFKEEKIDALIKFPIKQKTLIRNASQQRFKSRTPVLRIPERRFPPQFQHLKPAPAFAKEEIDLEKLNPLIKDPAVDFIESNGHEKKILVKGRMGAKPTNIILTDEEINKIIQTFSEKSRIPAGEGIVKIVYGNLILSAVVSEENGSKFSIKKMPLTPFPSRVMPRR